MNFRPTCFKNCKEGAPFRRENTHLGQVHDGDMDVTLTSKRRLPRGPGVLQASKERGAPGPPLQDRPLSACARCRRHSPLGHHGQSHLGERESLHFALYAFLTFTNDLNVFSDCTKNTYRQKQNPGHVSDGRASSGDEVFGLVG